MRDAAEKFRRALLRVPPAERCIGLEHFPQGACDDASRMLGQYFFDNAFRLWRLRTGERYEPRGSHAWLEHGGLVVDITADQFPDVETEVVVTSDCTWYRQWTPTGGIHWACLDDESDDDDFGFDAPSRWSTYHRILRELDTAG